MKKIFFFVLAIIMVFTIYQKVKATELVEIPNEAIRIRIIPNSDSIEDQFMKKQVKDYVEDKMYHLLEDTTSIDIARMTIRETIPILEEDIQNIFVENNYSQEFKIKYGANYFPQKEYKGTSYEEGYYESLVIEIGEAKGSNWWCVLFPPLCMLEAEESETDEVEYKFLVQEILSKIFSN